MVPVAAILVIPLSEDFVFGDPDRADAVFIGAETPVPDSLLSSSWNIIAARDVDHAFQLARTADEEARPISLFLLDGRNEAARLPDQVNAIRAGAAPFASAPVIVLHDASDGILWPQGIDLLVQEIAVDDRDFAGILNQWKTPSLDVIHRIAETFDAKAVQSMARRLSARLEQALAEMHRGAIDTGEAHRLAGLCGTLGFAEAHKALLALSQAPESPLAEACRTSRLAVFALASNARFSVAD